MHFNLLDRESQDPGPHVHPDTPEAGEITEMWCLGHDVKEVFGGVGLTADGDP